MLDQSTILSKVDYSKLSPVHKKCCYLSGHPEKAVARTLPVFRLSDLTGDDAHWDIYLGAANAKARANCSVPAYVDYGTVCVMFCWFSHYWTLKEIPGKLAEFSALLSYEGMKAWIAKQMKEGGHVSLLHIRVSELCSEPEEYVRALVDYRAAHLAKSEEERRERAEKEARRKAAIVEEKQRKLEAAVADAERRIREGDGEVKNVPVEIWRSYYDRLDTTLVLHLLKRHGIEAPLVTQGWINRRLIGITYRADGSCSISMRGKGRINSIWPCLRELYQRVATPGSDNLEDQKIA